MSTHPITDKGEVAIDFPDKFYSGGFGRDSSFEARAEADGVLLPTASRSTRFTVNPYSMPHVVW